MTINQIYSVVNNIAQTMVNGQAQVVDFTSFVNFGKQVISSTTNKEQFYNTLCDRIGRTIFAIREYKAADRGILVDEFTFGSILQKISYKLQNAETASEWNKTPQSPYEVENKEGIIQNLFAQTLPTFSYTDVAYDFQLESAFVSPTAMGGFINGLYQRMYNALEVDIEGMNNYAIGALVSAVVDQATASVQVNPRRVVNLVSDYNTIHNTQLDAQTALSNQDFLRYACVEMGTLIPFLGKMTTMYNDGSVERFTTPDKLVVELNSRFEKSYNTYLTSDTYHEQMVALPLYKEVPYWENPNAEMNIYKADGNEAVENVVAIFRDIDSVVSTLERKRLINKYDEWNARTVFKLSADKRFIADPSENVVIFTLN